MKATLLFVALSTLCIECAVCFQPSFWNFKPSCSALTAKSLHSNYHSAEDKPLNLGQLRANFVSENKEAPALDSGCGNDGNGLNGGRGWFFGNWGGSNHGGRGGFIGGRWGLIPAAWAFDAAPRVYNSSVVESDTGIKYPPKILVEGGDKSGLVLIGGIYPVFCLCIYAADKYTIYIDDILTLYSCTEFVVLLPCTNRITH